MLPPPCPYPLFLLLILPLLAQCEVGPTRSLVDGAIDLDSLTSYSSLSTSLRKQQQQQQQPFDIAQPRDIISSLQQGVSDLGNGIQQFLGTESSANTPTAKTAASEGVQNALGKGEDPSPLSRIEADGQRHYYFPTVDFSTGVYMQSSTDLNTVLSVPSNEYKIYTYDEDVGTEAPGFFMWDQNTYLLYVSSVGSQGNGSLRALQNPGENLLSNWTDLGEIFDSNGNSLNNYDAFAFVHPNGNRYLLYSALTSVLIAQLTSYTTIGSKILTIASSNGHTTVEAPGTYISNGTLNFFWSENVYSTPSYNIINRAVSAYADPLDSSTWSFADNVTILSSSSSAGVYGPGSGATFVGPDNDPWLAYTCFYDSAGFNQSINPRRVQAQPILLIDDVIQVITPATPTVNTGDQ